MSFGTHTIHTAVGGHSNGRPSTREQLIKINKMFGRLDYKQISVHRWKVVKIIQENHNYNLMTMKVHTTNYQDTFIEVSEDTKATYGTKPQSKGDKKTIAEMQYELIVKNPYKYTSDDILFQVFADRNDLSKAEYKQAREQFFSKGQPCLRVSPLTKTYGFGLHCDSNGKIALYGVETPEYEKCIANRNLKKVKAMKSRR